jgi:hypothetical protein
MWPSFDEALNAFAETIVQAKRPTPQGTDQLAHEVARFLKSVHRRMPDYLRPPFVLLVLLFDAWSLPRTGKPFHRLGHLARSAQVDAWRRSRLEFRRRFVEFYGSLAIFGLYSDLYGRDYQYDKVHDREQR